GLHSCRPSFITGQFRPHISVSRTRPNSWRAFKGIPEGGWTIAKLSTAVRAPSATVGRAVPIPYNFRMNGHSQWIHQIRAWARELGFSEIGVSGVDLSSAEPRLLQWLAQGYHGDLHYMERHGLKRARPAELVPGTLSVITARMPYLPRGTGPGWQSRELARLADPGEGVVSLYAR